MTAEEYIRKELEGWIETSDLTKCIALTLREIYKKRIFGESGSFVDIAYSLGFVEIRKNKPPVLTKSGTDIYNQLVEERYFKDD